MSDLNAEKIVRNTKRLKRKILCKHQTKQKKNSIENHDVAANQSYAYKAYKPYV